MSSLCPVTVGIQMPPSPIPFHLCVHASRCFVALIFPAEIQIFPSPTPGRLLSSSCYCIQPTFIEHLAMAGTIESTFLTLRTTLGSRYYYPTSPTTEVLSRAVTYIRYDWQRCHVSSSLLVSGLELVQATSPLLPLIWRG